MAITRSVYVDTGIYRKEFKIEDKYLRWAKNRAKRIWEVSKMNVGTGGPRLTLLPTVLV
jgi:hypothetical protein